ncbi:MAG: RNase adapter RapZ, partial [Rhodospirillales bacterium]
MAIGIDVRTRGFGGEAFLQELDRLAQHADLDVRLLFLDCDDDALFRRYTETRRRHPLTADRPVADSVRHERLLVAPLRQRADLVIDTTLLTAADLKRALHGHFALERQGAMAVFVTSFAYRSGIPREADLVFDVRFLDNPHYHEGLRPLSGRDREVAEHIERDPGFKPFFEGLGGLLKPLLPRYVHEGKSYLTIAVGCTGGRHRSVFVAEKIAGWLNEVGYPVTLTHRDIDRDGGESPPGNRPQGSQSGGRTGGRA